MKRLILALATCIALSAGARDNVLSPATMIKAASATATRGVEEPVRAYIHIDNAALDRDALSLLGVVINMERDGIATATLPLSALNMLGNVEGIRYVEIATEARQMLDKAREATGIDAVGNGTGLPQGYRGKGVIIGIVDSGFDYNHIAFRDAAGNLRISRVWEQTAGGGVAPAKFGYGVEFTDAEAIIAAGGDIRNNSHGTHVAACAAGSDDYLDGILLGMAPEAELVLVSMREQGPGNVNISDGIAYIFDYADEVGKPCVVNLSLGSNMGPHDGSSTFDTLVDSMSGKGRLVVGASGNNRADKFHVSRTFSGCDDSALRTFIDFERSGSTAREKGEIDIWGSGEMTVDLLVVNTISGEIVETVPVFPSEDAMATLSLGRNVTGDITVASEISPLNGKTHISVASGVKNIRTNHAIALQVTPLGAGNADIWADDNYLALSSKKVEGYEEPGNASTVCEIGGTANSILTVGAYTTRKSYTLYNETTERFLDETVGDACSFSSCGPTVDGRMKPEVSAPGCFISSAVSSNDGSGTMQVSQVHTIGDIDHLYGFMQGTSMAAPIVSGIVATWLQAYPELSPQQLVEVVRNTAVNDEFTGDLPEGSNLWGFGKIDALGGILECIALQESGSVGFIDRNDNPDIVTFNPTEIGIAFGQSRSEAVVTIFSASGYLVAERNFGAVEAGDRVSVTTDSLSPGVYMLRIDNNVYKFIR